MATQVTKLDKAKASIVLTQPFFAALLLKYPLVAREDIPILAIDKRGALLVSDDVGNIIWRVRPKV